MALTVTITPATIAKLGTATAVATGGTAPYTYTISGGTLCTVDPDTGVITGHQSDETVTITATDSTPVTPDTGTEKLVVGEGVTLAVGTTFIEKGGEVTATASKGITSYVYSILPLTADSTIDGGTGVVTGGDVDEAIRVIVTDADGSTNEKTVYVGMGAVSEADMTFKLMSDIVTDWDTTHQDKYDRFEGMRVFRGLPTLVGYGDTDRPTSEYMALFMEAL